MILPRGKLYNPENVLKARYAQIIISILAIAISGYLGVSTWASMRSELNTRTLTAKEKMESGQLSRQASLLRNELQERPAPNTGGVERFAVRLSKWADARQVKITSLTPEGTPTESDIKVGETSLGKWNTVQVRVEGEGDYTRVISLLDQFRDPGIPVQLNSFILQSATASKNGMVGFELVLTVYGKKTE